MKVALALLLVLALGAGVAGAQSAAPVTLAFSTLGQGTAWYVYGATMAELLRKTLPSGSNIDVKPFSGGVGNPRLVAKNETPLGLSFTVTNRWAMEGKEGFDAKLDNLRGLVGGLDMLFYVANADTVTVPARGGALTQGDLRKQYDMYSVIWERLVKTLYGGGGPKEALAAKPTQEFDAAMGPSDVFVERAFQSLWAYLSPDA